MSDNAQNLPADASNAQASNEMDSQINKVLGGAVNEPAGNKSVMMAVALGVAGAVLGAVLWYFIAHTFNIQIGYLAILIGVMVGYGMKLMLKGTNSLKLGILAAVLAVFGLVLGNFGLWYFDMPGRAKKSAVESGELLQSEVDEVKDSEIRDLYPFTDYLKDDLTSSEGGNNPVISWLFYALAIFVAFNAVYNRKHKDANI